MWAIQNLTPYAAERTWNRDRNGAEVWLVAVRGTFLINPDGTTEIAEEQADVCLAPEYAGEPGQSSLLYESDLVHTKPTTDVIVHGQAYAPQGRPVQHVDVGIRVGPIQKRLRVFGDRMWLETPTGAGMTPPSPFTTMPITYERAFGGIDDTDPDRPDWDRRNPAGTGFARRPEHLVGKRAANVEDPRSLISSWADRPHPAGFGPIAGHWRPRGQYGGTYDEKWEKERLPLLPDDFDERFHLSAPVDQQAPAHLKGAEPVELYNLTPEGVLKFTLPRVTLGFETDFEGEIMHHRGTLHTVAIEPDMPRVIMVWHTALPCHHKVLKLQSTAIREKIQLGPRNGGQQPEAQMA